jgi:hypothetical protein
MVARVGLTEWGGGTVVVALVVGGEGGSGGHRRGRRGPAVPWCQDGGGVRTNQQEKRALVMLSEEGDRQRHVCRLLVKWG